MIGYLRGQVLESMDGKVLILASSESSGAGVGYQVTVPTGPSTLSLVPGKVAELFIYTHVREDALELYGFPTRVEKELFLSLLSVNGVGPKAAMGLLSRIECHSLIHAVLEGDREALTRVPGIGKKTAERVVFEAADLIRKKMEAGVFGNALPVRSSGASSRATTSSDGPAGGAWAAMAIFRDARDALVELGYREQEVSALLNRLLSDAPSPPSRVEDLVRTALKEMV